ncbi:MAG: hypothetical protein ACXVC1_07215, partial [Tumebacillaceae bacterium]
MSQNHNDVGISTATSEHPVQEDVHVLPWLTDIPRVSNREPEWGLHEFPISIELYEGVRRLAEQEGVLPTDVWLAAYAVFVNRYTGVESFGLGVWLVEETGSGSFAVDLSGAPTFAQLLQRVKDREPNAGVRAQNLFAIGAEWGAQANDIELSLDMTQVGAEWKGQLHYRSDLFAAHTIFRMARNLLVLVSGALHASDVLISKLP